MKQGVERLEPRLSTEPLFGLPSLKRNPAADLTVLTVPIRGDALGEQAVDAVRKLRGEWVPAAFPGVAEQVLVTGDTAEAIDVSDTMSRWLPVVFAFVLGLSFLLLTVAFRSIVVAAKAIAVNLLFVGAAYGLLVLVFQEGVGNELLGFEQVDTIESWVEPEVGAVDSAVVQLELRSSETSTSGGASDSEQKALTVVPRGRAASWLVTMASGVQTAPSASRKASGSTVTFPSLTSSSRGASKRALRHGSCPAVVTATAPPLASFGFNT